MHDLPSRSERWASPDDGLRVQQAYIAGRLAELPVKGSERYVTFRERLWAICMDACLDAWEASEPPSDDELDDIAAKVFAALREEECDG